MSNVSCKKACAGRWASFAAIVLVLVSPVKALGQEQGGGYWSVSGVWNLRMSSIAERPTRGVRNVLMEVSEIEGTESSLDVRVQNLRNQFVPVSDILYDESSRVLSFQYGVYGYELTFESESSISGQQSSPFGSLDVEGRRQSAEDLRFVGDTEPDFEMTRSGIIGHYTKAAPPSDALDPGEWVRSQIAGPEDWALVLRGGVTIGFTNAEDFVEELAKHAGETIRITAVWRGEKLEILGLSTP
jgi:hypothetical protein